MPAEHVKNIELALSYMRDARRSTTWIASLGISV
jgi:hypothetical protein